MLIGCDDEVCEGMVHVWGESIVSFGSVEGDIEASSFYFGEDVGGHGGITVIDFGYFLSEGFMVRV